MHSESPITAVILPTYNERDSLETMAQQILASPLAPHLIIVDDASPDGTGEVAAALAGKNPRVHPIHRPGKLGLGTAYLAGFRHALRLKAEQIITMDADFSHHPRYLPVLAANSGDAGLVIGSRYVDGGGIRNWDFGRRLLSRGANLFARTVLGLQAKDCTTGYRLYRREVLESIPLDKIFSDGYSFLIEMLYLCQKAGYRIQEVPIVFEDRRHGSSKISRKEIVKALYTVLRLRLLGPSSQP